MRSQATIFLWVLWYRRRIFGKVVNTIERSMYFCTWKSFKHMFLWIAVLEEQCLNETHLPKGTGAEEELKALRRQLRETAHAPAANILLNRILMKKPFSLECVRSLNSKEALLDEAIQSGNGDAILTVELMKYFLDYRFCNINLLGCSVHKTNIKSGNFLQTAWRTARCT